MFERLTEVRDCLELLNQHSPDLRLVQLYQGLHKALQEAQDDYQQLRQAADWLEQLAAILDAEDKSATQVRKALFDALESIQHESLTSPRMERFANAIYKTSRSYEKGLFHTYDIPALPRTNNDRESEFRELNRRLLRTTGQKGMVKRILQRQGAWELIPKPHSLKDTISALSQVEQDEFEKERHRFRLHRKRFRMHTRSPIQAAKQLTRLTKRWLELQANKSP